MFTFCIKDAVRLPVDSQSHLYEDITRDEHLYQDIPPSHLSPPPPSFDPRLPHQRTEWRSPARSQVHIIKKKHTSCDEESFSSIHDSYLSISRLSSKINRWYRAMIHGVRLQSRCNLSLSRPQSRRGGSSTFSRRGETRLFPLNCEESWSRIEEVGALTQQMAARCCAANVAMFYSFWILSHES